MYPDYPNNRLIVDGVDLSTRFKMVLLDGYTLEPPAPKVYTIDIPGGNGSIDLTEALTGDVVYNNRKQEFTFCIIGDENPEQTKTAISSFLHGRSFDYSITMDPDYIYHGRFTIGSFQHQMYVNGIVNIVKITVDSDPYKRKKNDMSVSVNAVGGNIITLTSGRAPVKPKFTSNVDFRIIRNNEITDFSAGTSTANNIVLTSGSNTMYIRTTKVHSLTWGKLLSDNRTFGEFKNNKLFEWYKSEYDGDTTTPDLTIKYKWEDI